MVDGNAEVLYEVVDYCAIDYSEHDQELDAPYPVPFVAIAASRGDEDELRAAIEQHPDSIDAPFQEGRTALHYSLPNPTLLARQKQDPASVDAVRKVREQMVGDLEMFGSEPSSDELAELCREWRSKRIELTGPPVYAPDMFIESVCQVIELS